MQSAHLFGEPPVQPQQQCVDVPQVVPEAPGQVPLEHIPQEPQPMLSLPLKSHVPCNPLQVPLQRNRPLHAVDGIGVPPAAMFEQVPGVARQVWQGPLQAELQQTPSREQTLLPVHCAQLPEKQFDAAQLPPAAICGLHVPPAAQ